MNHEESPSLDPARSRLRATVTSLGSLIAALPKQADDASNTLASSWADLVEQLALGPEPELRECPNCKKLGMRAASLCSHCWTKLTPPGKE